MREMMPRCHSITLIEFRSAFFSQTDSKDAFLIRVLSRIPYKSTTEKSVIQQYISCLVHTPNYRSSKQPSFQHPIVTLIYHKLFLPRWAGHTEEKGYNSISAYSEHGSGGGKHCCQLPARIFGLFNRK